MANGPDANPAHDSELQFRMLIRGVRDYAIYMLDMDGRIISWNSGARAIKGYEENEVVGRHFSMFYTEEDRASGRLRIPTIARRHSNLMPRSVPI